EGAPLRFELHVEVRPEVRLARLGGFRLHRRVAPVTAEQVEAQLGELRDRRAPWLPVEGEVPRLKDLVQVSIAQGLGAAAKDPQSHQFVLGEGRAIPDLEERILALRPGEAVDATVRYPADFPDEAKRGQTRDIRVTLQEVKRQQLAELTDDFAREVGDFDSLDALRRAIREDLERDAEREAEARVRAELIEQLVAANNIVAPRPLVERALWVYAQAYGVPEERLPQFATEFRSLAEQQVRRDLVLDHVAEREGLRASPDEVERRLRELAERRRAPVEQLRASLEKAGRLRDLERGLTEEKIFTFLLSQSTVEQT
ncbi:MAG: trigger factor, partial [Thermodesulfobacteriota bacterium]